jgi:hypothetical protein
MSTDIILSKVNGPQTPQSSGVESLLLAKEPVSIYNPEVPEEFQKLESHIIAGFAGIVAETKHTGRLQWRYGSTDFSHAFKLARMRHWNGSFIEVEAFLKYLWGRTHELVRQPCHWAAIVAVAEALLDRRRLSSEEARRVIGDVLKKEPYLCSQVLEYNDDKSLAIMEFMIRSTLKKGLL